MPRLFLEDASAQGHPEGARPEGPWLPIGYRGPALILTSLVLAFGLGVTWFSDLPSLRLFGWLGAFTLLAALAGDLLILPATAVLLRRIIHNVQARRYAALYQDIQQD